MVVGVDAKARALAQAIKERQGIVIVASHYRDKAQQLAHAVEARHVQFEALYTTMHDILVVCDEEKEQSKARSRTSDGGIHAAYLRPGMTVMDLTAPLRDTQLTQDAAARGCLVVRAKELLLAELQLQAQKLTSKEVPLSALTEALPSWYTEEA